MLASSFRLSLVRSTHRVPRIVSYYHVPRRFNSTSSTRSVFGMKIRVGHIIAGVTGGAAVVAGVYGWYHFSGVKDAVDSAVSFKTSVVNATQNIKQNAIAYFGTIGQKIREKIPDVKQVVKSRSQDVQDFMARGYYYILKVIKDKIETVKKLEDVKDLPKEDRSERTK